MVEHSQSLITFGVCFILVSIAIAHQLKIYKISFIHESGLYLMMGLFGGAIWLLVESEDTKYNFSPDIFFDVVLPPIIFSASYNLKRKRFINNFGSIMVLAIFGALLNFLIMSTVAIKLGNGFGLDDSECMLFAATMSATDGIAVVALIDSIAYPSIFGTLIGEGCINDAVAIILYSSIDALSQSNTSFKFSITDLGLMSVKVIETAFFSILIGVSVGLISALYFRLVRIQPSPKTELALLFLFGYLSYSISDIVHQSGIISVFFCGIFMSHYTYHSLTRDSQIASQDGFEAIGYGAETFIYISLGFYTFSYTDSANWSAVFLFSMLATLVVGRIIVVAICILIINVWRKKKDRISFKYQLIFWWGGIVRGSICFALSLRKITTHSSIIVTTTFAIVLITTFVIGSLTETFLVFIGMKDPDYKAVIMKRLSIDDGISNKWKKMIHYVDDHFMKRIFGGRKRRMYELSMDNPDFERHYERYQRNQASKIGSMYISPKANVDCNDESEHSLLKYAITDSSVYSEKYEKNYKNENSIQENESKSEDAVNEQSLNMRSNHAKNAGQPLLKKGCDLQKLSYNSYKSYSKQESGKCGNKI